MVNTAIDNISQSPVYTAGIETIAEYSRGEKATANTPSVRLLVSPFSCPGIPIELVAHNLGGLIMSYNYIKSRGNAGGTVEFTLAGDDDLLLSFDFPLSEAWAKAWKKTGPDLRNIFMPMTLVQVWRNGYHMLTGYVVACRRKAEVGQKTYSLVINELGMLLQGNILSVDLVKYGKDMNFINDSSLKTSSQTGVPLSQALKNYLNGYLATTMSYLHSLPFYLAMSDGLPLATRFIAKSAPLGAISDTGILNQLVVDQSMILSGGGGSFWDWLKTLVPNPWMEFFTESGGRSIVVQNVVGGIPVAALMPGFSYIVARTTPYSIPWMGISTDVMLMMMTMGIMDLLIAGDFIIITDDDVISKELGQSLEQQYTSFQVSYSGKGSGDPSAYVNRPSVARGPINPLMPGGVRTYGTKNFHANINPMSMKYMNLTFEAESQITNFTGGIGKAGYPALSSLLNLWFRNNAKFNEGTVTIKAKPYARPGMLCFYLPSLSGTRVDSISDIGVYYIDSMSDNMQVGGPETTTLQLIRGVPFPGSVETADIIGYFAALLLNWEIKPVYPNMADGA